jgi:hypothetical protein
MALIVNQLFRVIVGYGSIRVGETHAPCRNITMKNSSSGVVKIVGVVVGLSIGIVAVLIGSYGMDALLAFLPREMARMVIFAILGGVVYWFLKWIITEAVAEGIEKGITNLLSNSSIVRNEISAAIAEEKSEAKEQEDDYE